MHNYTERNTNSSTCSIMLVHWGIFLGHARLIRYLSLRKNLTILLFLSVKQWWKSKSSGFGDYRRAVVSVGAAVWWWVGEVRERERGESNESEGQMGNYGLRNCFSKEICWLTGVTFRMAPDFQLLEWCVCVWGCVRVCVILPFYKSRERHDGATGWNPAALLLFFSFLLV